MNILSPGEARLYSKYYGMDFIDDDKYWDDVLIYLKDVDIPMPMKYNPNTVRLVHDMLDCPPGNCGGCCNYQEVPLNRNDINRLISADVKLPEIHTKPDGSQYFSCLNGCPFLVDNTCSIYGHRPDACWIFPVQHSDMNDLLYIRVRCPASVRVIRAIITSAVKENDFLLLPNLLCLEKEV